MEIYLSLPKLNKNSMKKFKLVLMTLAAVLCCVTLAACGDDKDDAEEEINPLEGTWSCNESFGSGGEVMHQVEITMVLGDLGEGTYTRKDTDYQSGVTTTSGKVTYNTTTGYLSLIASDGTTETNAYTYTYNQFTWGGFTFTKK